MSEADQLDQESDGEEPYLNVTQAAAFLTVHPGTVRKAISDGRLTPTRIYGRVVVARTELERYRADTYPQGVAKRGRPASAPDKASEQHEA